MGRNQDMIERIQRSSGLTVDPIPGTPLIEISGGHRVLIEGHKGVREYSQERIIVCTRTGMISVCGERLEMAKMSREQLIIQGCIHAVSLNRRT